MEKKKITALLIGLGIVIAALIALLLYTMNKSSLKDEQIAATEEIMTTEKQQLENEYKDLAGEYDGYTMTIHNDSLLKLFNEEKLKVNKLLEELRTTKTSNAVRISELKKELATLRKVMVHYVNQIDSLNLQNKRLTNENYEVRQKYASASATAEQLSKEKESLNEVVTRAAILEVYNFSMTPLDKRNKATDRASKITTLQFNYTVGKNITAKPGMKTIFMRLTRPDDDVMTKSPDTFFSYENKEIAYSLSKDFEYSGEARNDVLYWKVEEIMQIGTYHADFFADGNRIGSFTFRIEKK